MKAISQAELIKRVNLRLMHDGERVNSSRVDSNQARKLGRYYLADAFRDTVLATDIDLEALARELGVLSSSEELMQ